MAEILKLPRGIPPEGKTSAEVMLKEALEAGLTDVIVIGWDANDEFFTNCNMADGPGALWLLRAAERKLWKDWDSKNG